MKKITFAPSEIQDMLCLIGMDVWIEEINEWDQEELNDVGAWASKTILRMNDNNVRVPSMPFVLIP